MADRNDEDPVPSNEGGDDSAQVNLTPKSKLPLNKEVSDQEDGVSLLSEDKTAESAKSIWSQAKMILLGQNPNDIIDEDKPEADDVLGLSVPGGNPVLNSNNPNDNNSQMAITTNFENGDATSPSRSVKWKTPIAAGNAGNNNPEGSETSVVSIDFLQDDLSEMTYSRRIALFLLRRYGWYNPGLNREQIPEDELESPADVLSPSSAKSGTPSSTSSGSTMRMIRDISAEELMHNDAYPFTHSRRENPSLERAWAYFEHVALSRYIVEPKPDGYQKKNCVVRIFRRFFRKGDQQLQRAEPGEKELKTALYKPIFTPHTQLGDFGLGIGLYFSTLRAITVLTFLAGILNAPNFLYFSSDEYNDPENPFVQQSTKTVMTKGSAICTDTSWVLCEDCDNESYDGLRKTTGFYEDGITNATFYKRNNCLGATIEQGMVNYATLLLIMIGTIGLNMYLNRMEIAFDEDEQTAQDYSVVVENPPPDATNPQEWHDFFKKAFGAHLTACTVAVDNDLLVKTLVARREILRKIELTVPPGTSLDTLTLARIAAKEERERRFWGKLKAKLAPGVPEMFASLTVLTAKVQGLAQQDYPATQVFLSFETEKAQRDVLYAYSLGSLDVKRNNIAKMKNPDKHLFRGNLILKVKEPDEPNTVRWQDLNEKFKDRLKQQALTTLCTFAAIFLIAVLVRLVNDKDVELTAILIAVFNSVFPMFAKLLTSFEAHSSEGGIQRSLYFKIAMFRWVNTAVVITIVTPFTSSLDNGELINQISALFFAEIVTTNAIQLLDPVGHLQRHFLAPRASTQDAMNLQMQGQTFELAERYTNMTKILFLALWYCAIYPGALFLCSFALFINYFTDRFSLMRTWKRAPHLGTQISQFSRRYFFSLAICAMAIVSSYYWSAFPFDNLCEAKDTKLNPSLNGIWTLNLPGQNDTAPAEQITVLLDESSTIYKYCLQDFLRYPGNIVSFPFVPRNQMEGREWMTDDQEIVTNIYGYSAVGVMFFILCSFAWGWFQSFMGLFRGSYDPCGDDMGINFSDVPSINSYVPQISSPVFSYPLLACNIDKIDPELLDWTDPDRPHSFYDLTKDANVLLRGKWFGDKVVFSQIAHWPPKPAKKKSKRRLEA